MIIKINCRVFCLLSAFFCLYFSAYSYAENAIAVMPCDPLSSEFLNAERRTVQRKRFKDNLALMKKERIDERTRLETALLEERLKAEALREEIEFFESTLEGLVVEDVEKNELRTRLNLLEEELNSKNKELTRLRKENSFLIDKREKIIDSRLFDYETKVNELRNEIFRLNALKDKSTEEHVRVYENRIKILQEYLNILTDGEWAFMNVEHDLYSDETAQILSLIRDKKEETQKIEEKISLLGNLYINESVYAEMEKSSIGIENEKTELYERLGTAFIESQQYDKAIKAFLDAVSLGNANPRVHYYLGLLYQYVKHDTEKALVAFKKYLYYEPSGEYTQKAEKIIDLIK